MCGILVFLRPICVFQDAERMFRQGSHRGPDKSTFRRLNNDQVWLGFHRLAINGLDESSSQPMHLNGVYLVCNGEIYNHTDLMRHMNITATTNSDCEVILHLYARYGIHQTLQMIDASEFAFVLYDSNNNTVYSARDPYGVRPLYKAIHPSGQVIFGSEVKMMQFNGSTYSVQTPGTVETWVGGNPVVIDTYSTLPFSYSIHNPVDSVRSVLYDAVRKRVMNTDRPMACLLSGGLDSSIIAALVVKVRYEFGITEPLETYSIGLPGAEDLRYAQIMADFLGTNHTNIILSENEFFSAIPEVIWAIESYDTTTVRASVGNYLAARHIAQHSSAKVIFNGDGADELAGGYLYFHYAPDAIAKDAECRRLLKDIHLFDALRSDKCIGSNGLEARTPFLDRSVVQTYMSLPVDTRFPIGQCEKYLLRVSFQDILPPAICWRKKEAFSDGVSSVNRSWYKIITEMIPQSIQQAFHSDMDMVSHNKPLTAEQYYYRSLYMFDVNLIPYFWMPRFVQSTDCSARTLSVWQTN